MQSNLQQNMKDKHFYNHDDVVHDNLNYMEKVSIKPENLCDRICIACLLPGILFQVSNNPSMNVNIFMICIVVTPLILKSNIDLFSYSAHKYINTHSTKLQ